MFPQIHKSARRGYLIYIFDQGFIQACFGGKLPPPKKNLQFSPKNFCHVGNYNLNVEGEK